MAFYALAVMNAGGVLGRIAPAYLADRIGRFNLLIPSAFLSGLSCLVFWFFAKSLVSVMVFSVFYGFLSGSFVSVLNPCVAQISDMPQIGTRIGMLYSILAFPCVPLLFRFMITSLTLYFYSKISPRRTRSGRTIRSWSWILQFHDYFLRFNYDIWFFLHFSCQTCPRSFSCACLIFFICPLSHRPDSKSRKNNEQKKPTLLDQA